MLNVVLGLLTTHLHGMQTIIGLYVGTEATTYAWTAQTSVRPCLLGSTLRPCDSVVVPRPYHTPTAPRPRQ